ncbi:hypothetical protein ACN47E_000371 [Coniothyrium glycines]
MAIPTSIDVFQHTYCTPFFLPSPPDLQCMIPAKQRAADNAIRLLIRTSPLSVGIPDYCFLLLKMGFVSSRDLGATDGTVVLQQASADGSSPHLVLVPAPSSTDPNDPLRWPKYKKHIAFASMCAFTFMTNYSIGGLAAAFYVLSVEFNKSMHGGDIASLAVPDPCTRHVQLLLGTYG